MSGKTDDKKGWGGDCREVERALNCRIIYKMLV